MPTAADLESLAPGEFFPIRTVSRLTGINSITLRAWERRYGLIRPVRTPTGHRVYRHEDIQLIRRILVLLDKGIAIGQVQRSLQSISVGDTHGAEPVAIRQINAETQWTAYRARMVNAITEFDEERLEDIYNETLAVHPIETVTQSLLIPLLRELGRRWETAEGSVAEEHFFGMYLRNKLGARYHHRTRRGYGPKILSACLPGEHHEVGVLLFALTAYEHGLRPILLGANMPLAELPAAAKRAQCKAIVLSGSIAPEHKVIAEELPALVAQAGMPVFVGGMASIIEHNAIAAAGAIPLGNDLVPGTRRIQSAVGLVTPKSSSKTSQ
ncbi:MAG TPA: MerR family transcriptional regulator [Steroidobacteraceae bacterium]|nr:MerR family transcriptional regulator [Steroidobacteraceae bacterium]